MVDWVRRFLLFSRPSLEVYPSDYVYQTGQFSAEAGFWRICLHYDVTLLASAMLGWCPPFGSSMVLGCGDQVVGVRDG
jgi:hypothetical protein